jgi:DNA-binding NarL/FixJ family response regulator
VRILVADDAAVVRSALRRIAGRLEHEIVAEAVDANEARVRSEETRPQIALVDSRLPPDGALGLIAFLAAQGVAVLVIASLAERALVREAVAAGARGALLRPLLASQAGDALAELARTLQA